MKVSVVIVSAKPTYQTLEALKNAPFEYEVVTSNIRGLGQARNSAAKQAKNDLILFLDDDLRNFHPSVWSQILSTGKGEFKMAFLRGYPCTRVFTIHADDFWKIGGFDERILYLGEDRDFFVRAIDAGMKFERISTDLFEHIPHRPRLKNIHIAMRMNDENMRFAVKYAHRHPDVFRWDMIEAFTGFHWRALVMRLIFLPKWIIKSFIVGVENV